VQPVLSHLGEELSVALLPPEQTRAEHPRPVHGEERADAVELRREDLEDDQRKGELAEGGADVGALERALCRPDLDELVGAQDDGSRPVQTEVVPVCCMSALCCCQSCYARLFSPVVACVLTSNMVVARRRDGNGVLVNGCGRVSVEAGSLAMLFELHEVRSREDFVK
jgi:hypothetical protein